MDDQRRQAAGWFRELRDRITTAFESLEDRGPGDGPEGRFVVTPTQRGEDGGGGLMSVMRGGRVFEKVGVNWSEVHGTLAPAAQAGRPEGAVGGRGAPISSRDRAEIVISPMVLFMYSGHRKS